MTEPSETDNKSLAEDGESTLLNTGRKTPSTDRVLTPDSQGRPKSTASGEIVFEAKKKRKRTGTPSSAGAEDAHDVTFTVTICMAVPTENDDQPDLRDILKKRMIDAPRAQNYYHLEYYLLPDDDELIKTDVVTYGVACKIYMERHDARVVKTWQDGDITWFAWAHSHTVTVTKDVLLKMFNHTIELRVWDTKDKCSSRARFDRPKAFRLPQPKPGEKPEDIGGVKSMVTKHMKNFVNQQPCKGEAIRPLPSQISVQNLEARKLASGLESRRSRSGLITPSASSKALVAVPNRDSKEGRAFSRLGLLAGADGLEERSSPRDKKNGQGSGGGKKDVKSTPSSTARSQNNSRAATRSNITSLDPNDDKPSRKISSHKEDRELRKQLAEQAKANAERIKKYGICSIPIRLSLLFGDKNTVTNRLDQPLAGVEDLFLTVSLNNPLLSPRQKQELNPMVIQVKNATNLPLTPMKYADLKLKCHPVFCKYKFFKEPEYTTPGKEHAKDIYWEDTNVVLIGTMKESELREYFSGPPMEIEVHDRDRKPEEVALRPTLFGDDLEDEKIANVGTVESRRTLHNPFHSRDKPWDPYGIAKIDLSELLLGHRFLEIKVPVHNCPLPDVLGNNENNSSVSNINKGNTNNSKIIGVAGSVDGPVETPLTAGDYVEDTAMLKMKIELSHPLTTPLKLAAKDDIPTTKECPFNRIVFIFEYHNLQLLHEIQSLVMEINAKALGLEAMPKHVIDAALSTYKLSVDQQCSLDLDIVTGFHVLDGERHIFVLEGLRDMAIKFLWNALPQPENSNVRVLYNSDLSFSKRLYGPLDVDLCRIKLHEPLSIIIQQSLLYIRDMVVRPCFDGLTKLDQLLQVRQMKDVVRNDLFLTTEMVVSMSREFGVPFTQKDFLELQPMPVEESVDSAPSQPQPYQAEPSRNWTPIDNFNHAYMSHLKEDKRERNFLEENIMDVQQKSEQCKAENERNKKPRISVEMDPAFNYSTQHLNSVELAHKKLRQHLKEQDPDARFAFNQEYLSAVVCPTDVVEDMRMAEAESKALWRTTKGWIFPGMKSTKDSNVHPRKPDTARLDELQEDWVENHLHTNIFKSPLDRGFLPWQIREHDFELFVKPLPDFGNKEPLSIHLPGVHKEAEKEAEKKKQYEEWRHRIIVDDVRQHFHRVLPETEMTMKGFYSSNQIDRQVALLKDPILKKAQAICGPNVNFIPSLAVVNDPYLDTRARAQGFKLNPAIPESSKARFCGFNPGQYAHTWSQNNNHIPCRDYEHDIFSSLKGQEFNVYHKEREKTSKRHIVKLNPEERENHLFRTPVFSASPYQRPLPALSERALTAQPILSTKSRKDREATDAGSSNIKNESNSATKETSAAQNEPTSDNNNLNSTSTKPEKPTPAPPVSKTTTEIQRGLTEAPTLAKNEMIPLADVPPQPVQVAA